MSKIAEELKSAMEIIRAFHETNSKLVVENRRLKAALEAIDDHGRALSFMEVLKDLKAENEILKTALLDCACGNKERLGLSPGIQTPSGQ